MASRRKGEGGWWCAVDPHEAFVEVGGVEEELGQRLAELPSSLEGPDPRLNEDAVDDSEHDGNEAVECDLGNVKVDLTEVEGVEAGEVEREEDEARGGGVLRLRERSSIKGRNKGRGEKDALE